MLPGRGQPITGPDRKLAGLRLLAILLALPLFLTACGPGRRLTPSQETSQTDPPGPTETAATKPSADPTQIIRGLPGNPEERLTLAVEDPAQFNLNPFANTVPALPVDPTGLFQPVYQTLVFYDPALMSYQPLLAEEVVHDQDQVTIRLPAGRLWQDGQVLTLSDVSFTIEAHQKLGTGIGQTFNRMLSHLETVDTQTLRLVLRQAPDHAASFLLDALAGMLITPEHVWRPLVYAADTAEALSARPLPLVGSGKWAFYHEDEFALSLVWANPAGPAPGQPLYLVLLKYKDLELMWGAFSNGDLDLIAGPAAVEALLQNLGTDTDTGVFLSSQLLRGHQKLAGISVNPSASQLTGLRSFRQLLSLASNPEGMGSLLLPGNPDIDRTEALTIPATLSSLEPDETALPAREPETISRLITESGLSRERGTGFLLHEGSPLQPLVLKHPDHSQAIREACLLFARRAEDQGFQIALLELPREAWQEAYETADYDLIYTESGLNESLAGLAQRLSAIPRFEREPGASFGIEFDGAAGYRHLFTLLTSQNNKDRIGRLKEVSDWMLREAVFIPLAGGDTSLALWNPARFQNLDLESLMPFPVRINPLLSLFD